MFSGVQALSAGHGHSLFLKNDGTVWAVGTNEYGTLGDGTTTDRQIPVQVMSGVRAVSAGNLHSLFLKTDGTVWACGYNANGQLGDGTTVDRTSPVQVLSDAQAISAGAEHSLFLKRDGSVWGCGYNFDGRLGGGVLANPTTPVQVRASARFISAGSFHSVFIDIDGTVWASGVNSAGQLGNGSTTTATSAVQVMTDAQAVAAGGSHTLFLKEDGTFWSTGDNTYGQLGDGSTAPSTIPLQVAPLIDQPAAWRQAQFGADATNPMISGWTVDPDKDGVANLLERAFNLNPLQPGVPIVDPVTGTFGLPFTSRTSTLNGPRLTITYIRLKASTNPGITYVPEFSSSLGAGSWSSDYSGISVESIDANWERVTVIDNPSVTPSTRFGRVRVVSVP